MHKLSTSVRSTHGQDGAVMLDIRQGQIFNVNLVGSRILELLAAGTPEPAIADAISKEFGVHRDTATKDMQEFLQALQELELLEAN
jgi:coenzyme PQQ synthesis protein D (PqqD)